MIFSRRNFLCGATATGIMIPSFMSMLGSEAAAAEANGKILVIVGMPGGSDGFGMVFPHASQVYTNYTKLRPSLAPSIAALDAAKTGFKSGNTSDYDLAFHPSMGALPGADPTNNLSHLYNAGKVALISGVGIPPDAVARTAHDTASYYQATGTVSINPSPGFASRILDQLHNPDFSAISLCGGPGKVLGGAKTVPISIGGTLESFNFNSWHDAGAAGTSSATDLNAQDPSFLGVSGNFADSIGGQALDYIGRIQGFARAVPATDYRTSYTPPGGNSVSSLFKSQFRQAARLIINNSPGRVYYISSSNYDTHHDQVNFQKAAMGEISESIAEFITYLRKNNKSSNVVVMTMSDFGRRPYENGNGGTDHGTASIGIVAGDSVKGGFYGTYPDFTANCMASDGNFKIYVDFRAVLSRIVASMNVDPLSIMPDFTSSGVTDPQLYLDSMRAVQNLIV